MKKKQLYNFVLDLVCLFSKSTACPTKNDGEQQCVPGSIAPASAHHQAALVDQEPDIFTLKLLFFPGIRFLNTFGNQDPYYPCGLHQDVKCRTVHLVSHPVFLGYEAGLQVRCHP